MEIRKDVERKIKTSRRGKIEMKRKLERIVECERVVKTEVFDGEKTGTQKGRGGERDERGLPSFPLSEHSQWLTDRSSAYSIQFEKHLDITFEEDSGLKMENGYEDEHV